MISHATRWIRSLAVLPVSDIVTTVPAARPAAGCGFSFCSHSVSPLAEASIAAICADCPDAGAIVDRNPVQSHPAIHTQEPGWLVVSAPAAGVVFAAVYSVATDT